MSLTSPRIELVSRFVNKEKPRIGSSLTSLHNLFVKKVDNDFALKVEYMSLAGSYEFFTWCFGSPMLYLLKRFLFGCTNVVKEKFPQ